MKTLLLIFAAILSMTSCNQKTKEATKPEKALVLYYSQTGATKTVAEELQKQLNADIEEIYAVDPYNGDFNATIARCQKEMAEGILPDIKEIKSVIKDYDVVYLGYPIWFGKAAPPALAFVKQYDLSGVKLVPFCTFGSGGKDTGEASIKENSIGKLNIIASYGLRNARVKFAPSEVEYFLKSNGLLEGEYEKKNDFSTMAPVTGKETEIFNQACGDYPMLHATPVRFSTRNVNAGTEYLFEAKDKGMGGETDIKILVNVYHENNLKPEFTEVIR